MNVDVGGIVGIAVREDAGIAVASNVEVNAIVGRAVNEGAIPVGCTITTSGEQAVAKINKPKIRYLGILTKDFVFIFFLLFENDYKLV